MALDKASASNLKRLIHNGIERKRKNLIFGLIDDIIGILPFNHEYKNKSKRKKLERILSYVQELRNKNDALMFANPDSVLAQEIQTLRKRISNLEKINQAYCNLLEAAGVSTDHLILDPTIPVQWKKRPLKYSESATAAGDIDDSEKNGGQSESVSVKQSNSHSVNPMNLLVTNLTNTSSSVISTTTSQQQQQFVLLTTTNGTNGLVNLAAVPVNFTAAPSNAENVSVESKDSKRPAQSKSPNALKTGQSRVQKPKKKEPIKKRAEPKKTRHKETQPLSKKKSTSAAKTKKVTLTTTIVEQTQEKKVSEKDVQPEECIFIEQLEKKKEIVENPQEKEEPPKPESMSKSENQKHPENSEAAKEKPGMEIQPTSKPDQESRSFEPVSVSVPPAPKSPIPPVPSSSSSSYYAASLLMLQPTTSESQQNDSLAKGKTVDVPAKEKTQQQQPATVFGTSEMSTQQSQQPKTLRNPSVYSFSETDYHSIYSDSDLTFASGSNHYHQDHYQSSNQIYANTQPSSGASTTATGFPPFPALPTTTTLFETSNVFPQNSNNKTATQNQSHHQFSNAFLNFNNQENQEASNACAGRYSTSRNKSQSNSRSKKSSTASLTSATSKSNPQPARTTQTTKSTTSKSSTAISSTSKRTLNENNYFMIPEIISNSSNNTGGQNQQAYQQPANDPHYHGQNHHRYLFGSSDYGGSRNTGQEHQLTHQQQQTNCSSANEEDQSQQSVEISSYCYPILFRPQATPTATTASSTTSTSVTQSTISSSANYLRPPSYQTTPPTPLYHHQNTPTNHVPNFNLSNIFPDITSSTAPPATAPVYHPYLQPSSSSTSTELTGVTAKPSSTVSSSSTSFHTTPNSRYTNNSNSNFLPKFTHAVPFTPMVTTTTSTSKSSVVSVDSLTSTDHSKTTYQHLSHHSGPSGHQNINQSNQNHHHYQPHFYHHHHHQHAATANFQNGQAVSSPPITRLRHNPAPFTNETDPNVSSRNTYPATTDSSFPGFHPYPPPPPPPAMDSSAMMNTQPINNAPSGVSSSHGQTTIPAHHSTAAGSSNFGNSFSSGGSSRNAGNTSGQSGAPAAPPPPHISFPLFNLHRADL